MGVIDLRYQRFNTVGGTGGGSGNDLGYFADETALTTAHPTGTDGQFAILGSTDTVWIWDGDTSAWVDSSITGTAHSHTNKAILDLITDAGSGAIITTAERNNLHTHANKVELDLISDGDHDVRTDNPHGVTKADVSLGNVDNTSDADKPISTATTTALSNKADLVGGLVPSSQLPSFVDDVLEFADLASFPVTGETGKIYVAIDTGSIYRWTGTVYVEISADAGAPVSSVNTQTGAVVLDADDIDDSATTNKFVTSSDLTNLGNLSGVNTGDQDLSGYVQTTEIDTLAELNSVVTDATLITDAPADGKEYIRKDNAWVEEVDAGGGSDENVKVSANDTTTGYLEDKVVGKAGKIVTTTLNDGADEDLEINIGADVFDKTVDDSDDITTGIVNLFTTSDQQSLINDAIGTRWESGLSTTPNAPADKLVDISSGVFYVDAVKYTHSGTADFDFTADFTALASGERQIAELYIDATNVVQRVLGTAVSGNSKAERPAHPTNTVCIAFVLLDKNKGEITTNDITDCTVEIGAGALDTDELVKITPNDTTAKYLQDTLVAGTNITINTLNAGGNEQLEIVAGGGAVTQHDRQIANSGTIQSTTSTVYVDVTGASITTNNLGGTGTYMIDFNADVEASIRGNENYFFIINVNGVDQVASERRFCVGRDADNDYHNFSMKFMVTGVANGQVIKVRFKQNAGAILSVDTRSLIIDGVLDTNVI